MSIKILTKTGEEITHIDDARAYNFDAGNRSGIVKGAYNEGRFYAISNVIAIDSCELRIAGHRVVIDTAESISLFNTPTTNTRYSMIAEIVVNDSSTPSFRLFIQASEINLIKQNLYRTSNGVGTYQLEIGRFTLTPSGTIEDVIRTADVITGGASDGVNNYIEIGTVTTNTISQGNQANVDIENVVDEQTGKTKTNFTFDLPATTGTTISVNGVEQTNLSFKSDPQTQLNQLSNPNLLINGDFRVNQRGKTSYTGAIYTIDRWQGSAYLTVTPQANGGVVLSSNGGQSYFIQRIEDTDTLWGKTITMSFSVNGVVYSATGTLPSNIPSQSTSFTTSDWINSSFRARLYYYLSSKTLAFTIDINDNVTITIDYAKLEIGSVATAFSPRPYAEELALCQRYCFLIKQYSRFRAEYYFSNSFTFLINVPVTMRNIYTITTNPSVNNFTLKTINNTDVDKEFSISYFSNTSGYIAVRATSSTSHGMTDAMIEANTDIIIDAEIY